MATIRVALAEDHVLLREGISRLVAASEDFKLVGVAGDLPQLLEIVAARARNWGSRRSSMSGSAATSRFS
jgi:DNA-binding NarL/FixJ family response regulator